MWFPEMLASVPDVPSTERELGTGVRAGRLDVVLGGR
jgi:hypothetical protein